MSKMKKKGLVPELRFPEFRSGDWEEKKITALFDFQDGYAFKSSEFIENDDDAIQVIRITDVNNKNANESKVFINRALISTLNLNKYLVTKGELLLSLTGAAGFNFFFWNGMQAVLNQRTCKIIPKTNEAKHLLRLLEPQIYDRINLRGEGQNNNLSKDFLNTLMVKVPTPKEQQRIADCLSSMDELISAHSQKLEALKVHKKGLMQNLFPAEGEKVPQLRFPEFRGSGDWEEIPLSQLGELIPGLTYTPEDVREEGLLVLRSSNVQEGRISLDDNVFVRPDIKGANISKEDDILICVRNGSKQLIGKNALIPRNIPHCTHGAFMTVFRSKNPAFVFHLFQTSAYDKQVASDLGATINSINGRQLKKYTFHVPKNGDEQSRIADCLSSLDELITAQSQKIESLKAHKNGLMQRLFPVMDEVGV